MAITDAFTNTNGTALSTHNASWTVRNGAIAINTNAIYPASATVQNLAHYAGTFPANHYAQVVYAVDGTNGNSGGPAVRVTTADAVGGYAGWICNYGGNKRRVMEVIASGATALEQDGTVPTIGHTYRLTASSTTLTLADDGATIITTSDATYTAGSPGVYFYNDQGSANTAVRYDDFECTDAEGGGGSTQPPRSMHQFRLRR